MDPLRWRYRAGRLTRAGSVPLLVGLVWLLSLLIWLGDAVARSRTARLACALVFAVSVLLLVWKGLG